MESTAYSRQDLETAIVHIGTGAFHRGHQAVYTDLSNEAAGTRWGIFGINLFGSADVVDALNAQHGLFTVVERSSHATLCRQVRSLTGALHTPQSGIQAAIEKLIEPQVKIVSLTVTEKGYCTDPQSRQLDLLNPLIRHDLANPQAPQSAIGLIVEALRLRRLHNLPPFSVMSCDNIPENGALTKGAVIAFAAQRDVTLADWIAQNVTFPGTMVDRIVPAMTEEAFALIEAETGRADPAGVVCEDFRQWVIEDNFVAGRPEWDRAGAMFVADVLPYEEMKLRMLNGSHSFLAYCGTLAGYEFIYQCMEDAVFNAAVRYLMVEEQANSLSPHLDLDVNQYANVLIARFSNPHIRHKTSQIAMDGSQKLPQRAIDPWRTLQMRGVNGTALTVLVAGWLHFVISAIARGEAVADPLNAEFHACVTTQKEAWAKALSLLQIKSIFGTLASDNPQFLHDVRQAFEAIETHGVKAAIQHLLVKANV
ncbi:MULTISPECIES: mannitol dehydrogenase family protein [Enterobacter cloacae complex]|nr:MULTISPECIES: mannitol dehydrogenase family protein [Enterobacter cloacae complex]EHF4962901.1 mannitol dehydrogenase family protein [Enterobacter hormaechei]EHF4978565.1 mannitol dehydrogenase family protein [Enterobacter hormaechei]EHF4982338.1 mannitol dehydrogenase family protein [Enterobacter hormaechei]EHF4987657.1 mannitol dehydrogenase family protein [Enterobacter hormaechei]EHF5027177.1 mannitol dehydrogenase family protein [Enterobacter hormaechei]